MIVILKNDINDSDREALTAWLTDRGVGVQLMHGQSRSVLGLIGDTSGIDKELVASFDGVEGVRAVSEQYRLSDRTHHPDDTVADVGGVKIGGGHFCVIAGPCAVESREQIISTAKAVRDCGADLLRGGAFKPRTSPYDFQGLGAEGLRLLKEARKESGLPIVSEIMSTGDLPLFEDVDLIQVGARNMQNFELLRELGRLRKPILLKRGLSATVNELLMSAEYIMSGGNTDIILCERGIRGFGEYTRNTLDLSAVPVLHELTHLPVIVDPSHATGKAALVPPMALAAAACGADGLMIEVHNDPVHALCDGAQALTPDGLGKLIKSVHDVRSAAE